MKISRKVCLVAIFAIFAAVFLTANAYAEPIEVGDFDGLLDAIATGGEAKLTADMAATSDMDFTKEFTLDLNGHKINANWWGLVIHNNVTIDDTSTEKKGEISPVLYVYILDDNTFTLNDGKIANDYNTIQFDDGKGGTFIMNGGELYYDNCTSGPAVIMFTENSFIMNGGTINQGCQTTEGMISAVELETNSVFTMNGGTINALSGTGVTVWADAEAIINRGTITGKHAAITTNGASNPNNQIYGNNAKITVNGGTLTSTDSVAIYAPSVNGATIINGGTITGKTGIEVRAGSLTVNGGTISGATDSLSTISNPSGASTYGAAIAVAQHGSRQTLDVTISSGTLTAFSPIAIVNPQGNDEEALSKVSVKLIGGEYNSSTDEPVKNEIQIISKYITGGVYSNIIPEDYIADGYVLSQRSDGKYIVTKIADPNNPETGDNIVPYLITFIMSTAGIVLALASKKHN